MKSVIGVLLGSVLMLSGAQVASAACTDTAAVAAARADVAAQCPCNGFAKHGEYTKCAKGVVKSRVDANLLPKNCRATVNKCARKSTCSKPGSVTCCRTNKKGVTKCSVKKDATKCKAPKGGSACVGLFASCCDACTASGCAGVPPTPTPTPAPTQTPPQTPTPAPTPTAPPYGSVSQAFIVDVPSLLQ